MHSSPHSLGRPIDVCLSGITGEVGRALSTALSSDEGIRLSSAVARSSAGQSVGSALGRDCDVVIRSSVEEALAQDKFDVLVDYTSASIAYQNAHAAVAAGVHVVAGSSGITAEQFESLDRQAREQRVGILTGNFAVTASLAQIFASCAAPYVDSWEIIEYAMPSKIDAPSGTALELAERLAKKVPSRASAPAGSLVGDRHARGAAVQGSTIHSIRLPGFISAVEIVMGRKNERLTIRHETTDRAMPYIEGTLLAIREVIHIVGLRQGLEAVLDLPLSSPSPGEREAHSGDVGQFGNAKPKLGAT